MQRQILKYNRDNLVITTYKRKIEGFDGSSCLLNSKKRKIEWTNKKKVM